MKVMVVEDSQFIRERIVQLLSDMVGEQSVLAVGCVSDAVKQINQAPPTIILLDFLLPDGNGLEVLKLIREQSLPTQVMVMTNNPNEHYRKRSLQLGASHFFDKVKEFDQIFSAFAGMFPKLG